PLGGLGILASHILLSVLWRFAHRKTYHWLVLLEPLGWSTDCTVQFSPGLLSWRILAQQTRQPWLISAQKLPRKTECKYWKTLRKYSLSSRKFYFIRL